MVYVDKSMFIEKLLESEHRFYRMCRPGRFGKSNFLQMLNAFFSGQKTLFEGLAIYEKHDWQQTYPIIYLDFSTMDLSSLNALDASLNAAIVQTGRTYGIEINESLPLYPDDLKDFHKEQCGNDSKVGQLLHHLSDQGRKERSIVVLIDEYDWPRQLHSPRNHIVKVRDRTIVNAYLNPFFHQFERMKRYIRFLFATCTTITSYWTRSRGEYPNCPMEMRDLTFDPQFSQMIGLTGSELQSQLKPHIEAVASQSPNETFDSIVQRLRARYNGYCFSRENVSSDGQCRLYNFHSVVTCLRDKKLDYAWHPAGDSKYNVIDDYPVTSLWASESAMRYVTGAHPDTFLVSRDELEDSNPVSATMPVSVCMVLYGYLTLRGYDEQSGKFLLAFPNEEIRASFQRGILKFLLGREISLQDFFGTCRSVRVSTLRGSAKAFVDTLNTLAFRPESKDHMYSHKYPQMLYSPQRIVEVFNMCDSSLRENANGEQEGLKVELYDEYRSEDRKDRTEYFGLKVELAGQVECWVRFEFQRSASSAVNVLLKAMNSEEVQNRTIHLLGVNVDSREVPIDDWIWITFAGGEFGNVQASNQHYIAMYKAYVANVRPKPTAE